MSACSNCGRSGHFFRECKEPITSLGILAYQSGDKTRWLLIRRRDSLGYIEIMRGKYTDEESIASLLDQTTIEERERLLKKSFAELWRLLWNGPASRRYHVEYEQAKSKHDNLLVSGRLERLIGSTKTTWTEAEWGFPKGRRSSIETELACALRETYEEAGIPKEKLRITDVAPLIEEFRGSNGIRYRHKYWLAQAPATLEVSMNPANLDQAREISAVRWCTYEEAMALIRPYNVEKRNLLEKANGLLKTS